MTVGGTATAGVPRGCFGAIMIPLRVPRSPPRHVASSAAQILVRGFDRVSRDP
jgi:hypothetical protein